MRIGILGGTFNPIHIGHLVLGEEAVETLNLTTLLFVPSYLPPHKDDRNLIKARDRYAMCALAVKSNPRFGVSKAEIARKGTSYSVHTIRAFKKKYGNDSQLFFITGSDSLEELSSWKDLDNILYLCEFVIASRPGYPLTKVPPSATVIPITPVDISSTKIRQRIKEGKSIRYLVPEPVRRFIIENKLYR